LANFIVGTVENIEVKGIYQESVFDADLKLRHSSGYELTIFDGIHQLSQELSLGEVYEVLLVPLVVTQANYFSSPIANPDSGLNGLIIELKWSPRSLSYKFSVPELYQDYHGNDRTWILVQTSFGDVIISHSEIKEKVQGNIDVGGFLQWQASRLDLYAVV